ncbi:MAG: hypothetical protein WAM53_09940, partial [Terrimicrobiaceae bacterium]
MKIISSAKALALATNARGVMLARFLFSGAKCKGDRPDFRPHPSPGASETTNSTLRKLFTCNPLHQGLIAGLQLSNFHACFAADVMSTSMKNRNSLI